jgi:hypothetical protein
MRVKGALARKPALHRWPPCCDCGVQPWVLGIGHDCGTPRPPFRIFLRFTEHPDAHLFGRIAGRRFTDLAQVLELNSGGLHPLAKGLVFAFLPARVSDQLVEQNHRARHDAFGHQPQDAGRGGIQVAINMQKRNWTRVLSQEPSSARPGRNAIAPGACRSS